MLCQDEGLVIKTLRYSDYKLISWIFTANHGLLPFMTSVDKKNSNIMNPGNIVELHWRKKNCSLLFAKCAVKLATTAHIILQYREIKLLNVVLEIIGATVQEGNVHEKFLYESAAQLVDALATNEPYEKQLLLYCCFELALLQDAGYGLQLSRCVATGSSDNLLYISPKTGNAVSAEAGMQYRDRLLPYPKVLQHGAVSIAAIAEALKVCRYFVHKHFFIPYDKNMPNGRFLLESELEG